MMRNLLLVAAAFVVAWAFGTHLNRSEVKDRSTLFTSERAAFSVKVSAPLSERTEEISSPWGVLEQLGYEGQRDDVTYRVQSYELAPVLKKEFDGGNFLGTTSALFEPVKGRLISQRPAGSQLYGGGVEYTVSLPDGRHDSIEQILVGRKYVRRLQVVLPKRPDYDQDLYTHRFLESFSETLSPTLPRRPQ